MQTTYAIVGVGDRSRMYSKAVLETYRGRCRLVAMCDLNSRRIAYWNQRYTVEGLLSAPLPSYGPGQFDEMIQTHKPQWIIVTSMDRTHHHYICRAMELGCNVISEKPMTTDAAKCQQILDTIARTGRQLIVTFNYRYSPRNAKVKELLQNGAIGEVLSVHFEWLLDTVHGADYFRRWHRDKRNSGGLMVHKATHHFDLVNWWLGAAPVEVYAMGRLGFYGRENAERRGVKPLYHRYMDHPAAAQDPFAIHLKRPDEYYELRKGLYIDAEAEDGYIRDMNVFESGISIEDSMSVLVRYDSQAQLSYSLNAFCPWEGYRVMFNGTEGRLEFDVVERSYISAVQEDQNDPDLDPSKIQHDDTTSETIHIQKLWGKREPVEIETVLTGHGGGDERLLEDIFGERKPDPLGRAAGYIDGARSILVGIAANQAFERRQPIDVRTLVSFPQC